LIEVAVELLVLVLVVVVVALASVAAEEDELSVDVVGSWWCGTVVVVTE